MCLKINEKTYDSGNSTYAFFLFYRAYKILWSEALLGTKSGKRGNAYEKAELIVMFIGAW